MSCKTEILGDPRLQVFCILVVCLVVFFLSVCFLGSLCVSFVFLGAFWALCLLLPACPSALFRGFRARPGSIFLAFFRMLDQFLLFFEV